ncbi:hypothetical protein ABE504_09575 [Paenibacillus oryzisoli]|uniref:hypothetical protein n=1 Tax=Paenibacillus oryzisoli TaxID=1850517 RepID=UPI003D26D07C
MAKALRPAKLDNGQGKVLRRMPGTLKPTQRLSRFTVLWVSTSGVPFQTAGFTCTASTVGGTRLATVRFDNYGTAVFRSIGTPTTRTLIIRTFDQDGVLFRTRTVPSGVAAFAIIG